jgi:hypothetical protein
LGSSATTPLRLAGFASEPSPHAKSIPRYLRGRTIASKASRALVQAGLESGGPGEALKRFFVLAGGAANWESLDAHLREAGTGRHDPPFLRRVSGPFD